LTAEAEATELDLTAEAEATEPPFDNVITPLIARRLLRAQDRLRYVSMSRKRCNEVPPLILRVPQDERDAALVEGGAGDRQ